MDQGAFNNALEASLNFENLLKSLFHRWVSEAHPIHNSCIAVLLYPFLAYMCSTRGLYERVLPVESKHSKLSSTNDAAYRQTRNADHRQNSSIMVTSVFFLTVSDISHNSIDLAREERAFPPVYRPIWYTEKKRKKKNGRPPGSSVVLDGNCGSPRSNSI